MTNIYILAVGGTPPSPWTRQTAYDTRYVKFTGTPASHGVTGGAYTHVHGVTNRTVASTPSYSVGHEYYATNSWIAAHAHTVATDSFGSANNAPPYYEMALWYMDYTVWEATERRFPAGAILLSNTAINSDQLTRHTASDWRLIRLGNPGGTGGSATHLHSYTLSTDSTQAKFTVVDPGFINVDDGIYATHSTYTMALTQFIHSHATTTIYTSTATSVPYNIATRLYNATALTTRADAGVICFIDGTPSANWTVLTGWSGFFAASANQNAVGTGNSTHGHTLSGNTAGAPLESYWARYQAWGDFHTYFSPQLTGDATNHYHNYSATVTDQSHEPAFVYLAPMVLNSTLYHVNVYTLAETSDVLIRKTRTDTINPDVVMRKALTIADPMKMLLQKFNIESTYDLDSAVLQQSDLDLENVTARFKKPTDTGLSASVVIAILSNAWDMSMRLVRYWNPRGKPVLDSIMKGWIREIQTVDNKIQVMYLNNSLDYAIGSELDTKWGEVYELPRLAGESDDEYRKRIKTYVMMQTGSGTKATIEAVLDTITEETGTSRVETLTPGRVKIYFDSGTALHHAYSHKDLIDYVLPQALSVGVYYDVYYTFVDYLLDAYLLGFKNVSYEMDHLEAYTDLERDLYMYVTTLDQLEVTYDMDSSAKSTMEKVLYALTQVLQLFAKTFTVVSTVKKTLEKTYESTVRTLHRNVLTTYEHSACIQKSNTRQLLLDIETMKIKETIYNVSVSLV